MRTFLRKYGLLSIVLALALVVAACGSVTNGDNPTIATQPADQKVVVGQTATFLVTSSNADSYQWEKNGSNIDGATSASYTTPATTMDDNGSLFTVVLKNSSGTTTSKAAKLTVTQKSDGPTITTQPLSQSVTVGQTATFTVVATGADSYQWQKNGTAIDGATHASYTTPATTIGDNGATFTVVVSNAQGSTTSNPATLTVTQQEQPTPTPTPITVTGCVAATQPTSQQDVANQFGGVAGDWSTQGNNGWIYRAGAGGPETKAFIVGNRMIVDSGNAGRLYPGDHVGPDVSLSLYFHVSDTDLAGHNPCA